MPRLRDIDLLALVGAGCCLALAWGSRHSLNPDGVAYFDLATALRHGDMGHFVQGYWPPLYPALIALLGAVTGATGHKVTLLAHGLNLVAALGAIALTWHWMRGCPGPVRRCLALGLPVICFGALPSIDVVTPDVVQLFLALAFARVILNGNGRGLWLGALAGMLFLNRTSSWPWLLGTGVLLLWFAAPARRMAVLRAAVIACALAALWIVPISRRAGHATIGASGRLNACWYLRQCDSQTPDDHSGDHRAYRIISVDDSLDLRYAVFDNSRAWTYQPWNDPDRWDAGVVSRDSTPIELGWLVKFWLQNLKDALLAAWPLALALIACVTTLAFDDRDPAHRGLLLVLSGGIGVAQFVGVHVEPRLIGPFLALIGAGVLSLAGSARKADGPAWKRVLPVALVWGMILMLAAMQVHGAAAYDEWMQRPSESGGPTVAGRGRVLIVGEATPVMEILYREGAHVTAQILPASAAALAQRDASRQITLLRQYFAGSADVAWIVRHDGTFETFPLR